MNSKLLLGLALACSAAISFAAEWNLLPITGHQVNTWMKDKPNWEWNKENPYTADGAAWTLFSQNLPDPAMEEEMTPFIKAIYCKYYFVWGNGEYNSPKAHYRDFTLTSVSHTETGAGPSAGVSFTPENAGKYTFDIAGSGEATIPPCGYVRVQIYQYSQKDKSAKALQEVFLGKKGGYQGHPQDFKWNGSLQMTPNDSLVVRVQVFNAGAATAGWGKLKFTQFKVSSAN